LKELQEKKYQLPYSDLSRMLDKLLEKGVIESLESKCPEEARRLTNQKHYRYHRVISHPHEKCIKLKECIMKLAKDGKIILNLDDTI